MKIDLILRADFRQIFRSSILVLKLLCGSLVTNPNFKTAPLSDTVVTSMLDLNFVRDHLELVEEKLRQRGANPDDLLRNFREIDTRRRAAITETENLKAQRNRASDEIAKLKKNKQDATALIEETKNLRGQIEEREKAAEAADGELREILNSIPNLPHESVPVGRSEADNKEVRRWGTPREFSFTPKPHWELGEQLGILDLERAAKITGGALCRVLGHGRASWSARWRTSCSTCTRRSTDTPRCCRPSW